MAYQQSYSYGTATQPSYSFGSNNPAYPHVPTNPHIPTQPQYGYSGQNNYPKYPSQPVYNAQYPHQSPQVVIVNQPHHVQPIHGQPQNVRNWSSGMCGCFEDCRICCLSFWCLPCFQCYLADKMGECCCGPFFCGGCGSKAMGMHCPANPNTYLIAMRTKMRSQHGIQGSICDDVCDTWCCECCVTAQMARQMKHQGLY